MPNDEIERLISGEADRDREDQKKTFDREFCQTSIKTAQSQCDEIKEKLKKFEEAFLPCVKPYEYEGFSLEWHSDELDVSYSSHPEKHKILKPFLALSCFEEKKRFRIDYKLAGFYTRSSLTGYAIQVQKFRQEPWTFESRGNNGCGGSAISYTTNWRGIVSSREWRHESDVSPPYTNDNIMTFDIALDMAKVSLANEIKEKRSPTTVSGKLKKWFGLSVGISAGLSGLFVQAHGNEEFQAPQARIVETIDTPPSTCPLITYDV